MTSYYRYFLIFFPALLILFTAGCSDRKPLIIGAKIYEDSNHRQLIKDWKSAGINTAFISKELACADSFRKLLVNNKIPFFIIWPVFQNPEYLHNNPDAFAITNNGNRAKDDWLEFVCPSRLTYRKLQLDSISLYTERFRPDGLSIDFIRQFVYWEMIYPDSDPGKLSNACYCDSCISGFMAETGTDIPDTLVTIQQKAQFLKGYYETEWNTFRCELITSMVKEIYETVKKIDPSIKINLHIVPWKKNDFKGSIINIAGQDISGMAKYADFISPMCYSQMLKRDPGWIESVVADMNEMAPGKILPSIQVYPYYIDYPFTADSLMRSLNCALTPPSKGVIFWSWTLLKKDPERVQMISKLLK